MDTSWKAGPIGFSPSRRNVLKGGAALVAGTALIGLSACGGDEDKVIRIDAKDYGALDDNVTDNAPAFRRAFSAATKKIGKNGVGSVDVIVKGGGTGYRCGSLTIPDHVRLVGSGTMPVLTPMQPLDRWLQAAEGSSAAGLSGLKLDTAGMVSQTVFTVSRKAKKVSLEKVQIVNSTGTPARAGVETRSGNVGLSLTGCAINDSIVGVQMTQDPRSIQITDCTFDRWVQRAVWVRSTAQAATSDLEIRRCTIGPPAPGGSVRQPIQINAHDDLPIIGVRIIDNHVRGTGTDHKDVANPGTADLISLHRCQDFEVSGNTCIDGGEVGITVSQQSNKGKVLRNTCTNNGAAGIAIGSGTSDFVRDIVVADNVCNNNGRPGNDDDTNNPGRSGIYVYNAKNVTLSNNICGNTGKTKSQMYGLWIVSSKVKLESNKLTGNNLSSVGRPK